MPTVHANSSVATAHPTATIRSGVVRGRMIEGTAAYLGVPFAAGPVGPLRFQAPQPAANWDGIRDCFDYGPTAPQPIQRVTLIPEPISDGDDYLNLNIFAPPSQSSKAPVLVWVHGGGFFSGCNRSPWYRGHRFARDGIVLVALNYRLGAEGFMPMRGAPENRAVLDWIAALEWVRDNIAAFGGDPQNVTIAGQSAGAIACAYLMTMPRAKGLFRRVIAMSGSIGLGLGAERAEAIGAAFRKTLGAGDDAVELARIPTTQFIDAQARFSGADAEGQPTPNVFAQQMGQGLLFQPVIDGTLILQSATRAIIAGAGADVPMLLSLTAHEFDFLVPDDGSPYSQDELGRGLLAFGFDRDDSAAYAKFHRDLPTRTVLGRAISDAYFRARAVETAEIRIKTPASTYLCEFRWSPSPPVPGNFGACHCIDVPFAFDVMDAEQISRFAGSNPPQSLATHLHGALVGFVKEQGPGWAPYREDRREAMLFDSAPGTHPDPFRDERKLWGASRWVRS